jgi:FkbM family methyltransferase
LKSKGKIAFVKFGGLSAGGTERWLQTMAVLMQERGFTVDFYYCDSAPYIGSSFVHPDTDGHRKKFLENNAVNLIKFKVGFKDITIPTHDWVDTDFWEVFDQTKYDLVQTAKAGPAEYPYYLMDIPVIEYITLSAGVDHSSNIAWSIHISQWQRKLWMHGGGNVSRSSVIPLVPDKPVTNQNLRKALSIPIDAFVAGLHQRNSEYIFSDWPLDAFQHLSRDAHFILLGGAESYKKQAQKLGIRNFHHIPHSADPHLISSFLNSLDIYLHGRKDGETFGNVLAEALLHGVPCISHYSASGANGQIETIGPGGKFLKSRLEYKEALMRMYSDPVSRRRFGELGKQHAEKYFNATHAGNLLEQLYLRVISGQEYVPVAQSTPVSFALSHLGYLVAGDLEDKSAVESHAIYGGNPERFDVKISNFLNSKHSKVFFDVGAKSGLYSAEVAFHNPSAQIYAFEADPKSLEKIEATATLNGWAQRFQIFPLGVSDRHGKLTSNLSSSNSTFDNSWNSYKSERSIICKSDSLDKFVEFNSIKKIDFIKIDADGREAQVLYGASKTIQRLRPILFVRVTLIVNKGESLNSSFEKVFTFATKMNYRVLRSNGRGMLFLCRRNSKVRDVQMCLLIPQEVAFLVALKLLVSISAYHLSNICSRAFTFFDFTKRKSLLLYNLFKSGALFSKKTFVSLSKARKS